MPVRLTSGFVTILCLWLLVLASEAAEMVTLTDKSGNSIEVRLITGDDSSVTVKRLSDRKEFAIPLDRLDDVSKERVQLWLAKGGGLAKKFEIEVDTGKNRRTTGQEDFDDKRVNLDPVVTITNEHTKMPSVPAKLTVVFFGRPIADTSALYVFKTMTFDLPKLGPGESKEFKVGKISSAYDDRGYAKFGARYGGYVVVVHDEAGAKSFAARSVPTKLAEDGPLPYLKLENKLSYDRSFEELDLPKYTDM